MQRFKKLSIFITPMIVAVVVFSISNVFAKEHEMIQFTSDGHVLGFEKTGMYAATGSHVLRIGFAGTKGVMPESISGSLDSEKAMPLKEVRYPELWEGITLVYTKTDKDIFESTYYIEPDANVANIRLVYNVPVTKAKNGSLNLQFETGYMTESPPEAWQEINGKKVPISVSFRKIAENEAGFELGQYNQELPVIIDPVLSWNTFMGSAAGLDYSYAIAIDGSGNVYVAGLSTATWGSPINEHAGSGGDYDAFAAKLNSSGVLQWNTFMGSADNDYGKAIAVDGSGNVYVAGYSYAAWGSPVNEYAGNHDAFAAKLHSSGTLLWNTFMGSSGYDDGYAIAIDDSGNVYVAGYSDATWGSPVTVNPHAGIDDAFAAKLNSSGALVWNTFMGSTEWDYGYAIAVDGSGNVYVAGLSTATWGSPVNDHAGSNDVFAAKLNSSGALQWNTFMGSSGLDYGKAIAVDGSGNVYVSGYSDTTWGSPVNAYAGNTDAFAVKLNSSGALQWNTFMGSSTVEDEGYGIAVDSSGNVYVAGLSAATWGSPVYAFAGTEYPDAFATRLNSSGVLQWNTFMGSANTDTSKAIAVDGSGNVYVAGSSNTTWGAPVNAHAGGWDAFAIKFSSNSAMPCIPLLLLND